MCYTNGGILNKQEGVWNIMNYEFAKFPDGTLGV